MDRLSRFVQELKTFQVKDRWAQFRHRLDCASAAFDDAIGRLLDWLLMALSNSSLHRYAPVERLLRKITAAHDQVDLPDQTVSTGQKTADEVVTDEIVTQGRGPRQIPPTTVVSPRFAQVVARSARAALAGFAIVLLWWSWPSGQASATRTVAMNAASSNPASSGVGKSERNPVAD